MPGSRGGPKSWIGSGEAARAVWFALRDEVGATEFLGYETESAEGVVLASCETRRVSEAATGDEMPRVNQTPFMAESGGQAAYRRHLLSLRCELRFRERQKAGDLHLHLATVTHAR